MYIYIYACTHTHIYTVYTYTWQTNHYIPIFTKNTYIQILKYLSTCAGLKQVLKETWSE